MAGVTAVYLCCGSPPHWQRQCRCKLHEQQLAGECVLLVVLYMHGLNSSRHYIKHVLCTDVILLNSAASLVLPQQGCSSATGSVLYYKVMTSKWLSEHASLSHVVAATPTSLHFKLTQSHARLIKVPLFQKGELPTDDILVTITVHLEDPPTSDSDFLAGICDGTVCNALFI